VRRRATFEAASASGGAAKEGAAVHTVIARFHHLNRNLDELEADLVGAGARDAQITGYTVALTFGGDSREQAGEVARGVLDRIGATGIRIHRPKQGSRQGQAPPARSGVDPELTRRDDSGPAENAANLMAKLEMDVFGSP
jgi:hypothetical protein